MSEPSADLATPGRRSAICSASQVTSCSVGRPPTPLDHAEGYRCSPACSRRAENFVDDRVATIRS